MTRTMQQTGIRGPRRGTVRPEAEVTGHRPSWPCLYCPRLRRLAVPCWTDAVADFRLALDVFDAARRTVRQ